MAIVSSIHYNNITNEYNEGANYFRRFLQYAENVSTGNMQLATTILQGLVVNKPVVTTAISSNIVLKEIKQQLQQLGYEVAEQVGQSDFKCSLAIKAAAGDEEYCIGILLDDDKHYRNPNLVEQYYQRPAILQSFGWRTIHVFAKDWLQQPEKVMQQIIKRIKEMPVAEMMNEPANTTGIQPLEATQPQEQTENKLQSTAPQLLPGFENAVFERLVFSDAASNKFWEVAVVENKLLVRFGRVDTKGQLQVKSFDDPAKATREKDKLVNEKLSKGYLQQAS
jgi:predicted DNA-binding WGR domain protein